MTVTAEGGAPHVKLSGLNRAVDDSLRRNSPAGLLPQSLTVDRYDSTGGSSVRIRNPEFAAVRSLKIQKTGCGYRPTSSIGNAGEPAASRNRDVNWS